ncbi:hypothetical protein ACFYY8_02165 [Streptosporangium sp. NPDC001559]|uniref:hypothetical protein n=1 Tax=Streptosporangium sp. NPDC001559 TaxID=3366187 RepID=UPI0036E3A77E
MREVTAPPDSYARMQQFHVPVVAVRPGAGQPEIAPSRMVHDVPVEGAGGGLPVGPRRVEHDWRQEPAATAAVTTAGSVNGEVSW